MTPAETARIGIDIGGTFTDVVYQDGVASIRHEKVLTTPDDITRGIVAGLLKVEADVPRLELFLHGTTVALNALLEGKTPPVGLVTTEGFRDVLEIMRTNRPDMYDLQQVQPPPLVPRRFRKEISARMTASGEELRPVNEAAVRAIAREFDAAGIRSVAVCLLHSYAIDSHERLVRDLLIDERPESWVSISSDLSREWREFERTSTTVINAATAPIMDSYLRQLEERLAERGFNADLVIMQSNGGVMAAADARRRPVCTLMSGPVGGIAGGEEIARQLDKGGANLITLDIGGTSADAAIIDGGHAVHTPVARLNRWPILIPAIEIQSVGAGGGSIASVDEHGGLRVGPESAGAMPGPACYGLGGERATVTDANLVLGRIDGARFLFALDGDAARAAITRDVASRYGMTVEEAAEGVLTVVNSNMSRLLRDVLIQRGYDPHRFTLLAFGGGGGLHACNVADEAGLKRIVVPPHPGTLSAYGIFSADVRHDHVAMFIRLAQQANDDELEAAFRDLEAEVAGRIRYGDQLPRQMIRFAELRYVGQEYTVPVNANGTVGTTVEACTERFHREHSRLYGFAREGVAVEFVKLMASIVLHTRPRNQAERGYDPVEDSISTRLVWEGKAAREAAVYQRVALQTGVSLEGPCVVEEPGATTYVATTWTGQVDEFGNLVLQKTEAA